MPALGMQQDTGKLIAWLKSDGESVSKGDPIMEIETDKVTVEIEAPSSGILGGICAQAGDVVPVGQEVAWILTPGESEPKKDEIGQPSRVCVSPVARKLAEAYGVDLSMVKADGGRVQKDDVLKHLEASSGAGGARLSPASPKARRLVRERGLDLKDLVGTGPGHAVLAVDVPAADVPEASLPGTDVLASGLPVAETRMLEPGGMWQVMVDRLTGSWASTPQFYLVREVNASRLQAWRENSKQRTGSNLTYSDLLVKVVAASLARHPRLNASWHEGKITLHGEINVGLAVAVENGLVVPVLHRANELSLGQIAARREDLVSRAQAGKLTAEELSDGTFTISNLGMYGVDMFNAVVNPPQAAILAVGRIAERVVPIGGQAAVQPVMVLSLTCDHRAIDGARAAEFLQTMVRLVKDPMLLLE